MNNEASTIHQTLTDESKTVWCTGGTHDRNMCFTECWRPNTFFLLQPFSADDMGCIDAPEYFPAGSSRILYGLKCTSIAWRK